MHGPKQEQFGHKKPIFHKILLLHASWLEPLLDDSLKVRETEGRNAVGR